MKNINVGNKIQALIARKQPRSWDSEAWKNYEDSMFDAIHKVPNLGQLTPRELLKLSWILNDMSDQLKKGAVSQADWYKVMGVDDVTGILVEALDEYLAQLEE